MDIKKCPVCGHQNAGDANFCPYCSHTFGVSAGKSNLPGVRPEAAQRPMIIALSVVGFVLAMALLFGSIYYFSDENVPWYMRDVKDTGSYFIWSDDYYTSSDESISDSYWESTFSDWEGWESITESDYGSSEYTASKPFYGESSSKRAASSKASSKAPSKNSDQVTEWKSDPMPQKYYRMICDELLRLINEERTKNGIPALLPATNELEKAVALRAGEAAEKPSHTRPDGTSYKTALSLYGIDFDSQTEIISMTHIAAVNPNMPTTAEINEAAASLLKLWKSLDILRTDIQYFSVGFFWHSTNAAGNWYSNNFYAVGLGYGKKP